MEYAPKREMLGMLFYHKELPAADRAVEAARAAGKASQCPDEFNAVAKLRDDAFATYWACRTEEAIAMSNQAVSRANALCPQKVAAPQPPAPAPAPAPAPVPVPPPPPPLAPTVSITAAPASIVQGKCTTLTWTSANASSASIDQGLGSVSPSGSREVCPPATMQYSIAAVGAGGSQTASTAVTVTPPPPKVVDRLTVRVNFDLDKAIIRPADEAELQRAVAFVKKYPGSKLSIEGHTDSLASEEYNQGLSLRRATAVRDYFVKGGVADISRMTVVGRGESMPIADNGTPEGRFQNRRVEILILSE